MKNSIGWKLFCWPTFSSNVKVIPTHSPPASAAHSTEPFIRPVQPVPASTELPGSGFSAVKHHRPVKLRPTDPPLLPCFLAQAPLLLSISRPVKQNPADRPLLQSFLGPAPLLQSISRPVKHSLPDRPLLSLVPAPLQSNCQPASTDLSPTD